MAPKRGVIDGAIFAVGLAAVFAALYVTGLSPLIEWLGLIGGGFLAIAGAFYHDLPDANLRPYAVSWAIVVSGFVLTYGPFVVASDLESIPWHVVIPGVVLGTIGLSGKRYIRWKGNEEDSILQTYTRVEILLFRSLLIWILPLGVAVFFV